MKTRFLRMRHTTGSDCREQLNPRGTALLALLLCGAVLALHRLDIFRDIAGLQVRPLHAGPHAGHCLLKIGSEPTVRMYLCSRDLWKARLHKPR